MGSHPNCMNSPGLFIWDTDTTDELDTEMLGEDGTGWEALHQQGPGYHKGQREIPAEQWSGWEKAD